MREILFRGKRKDNGEWLQGDLRHWNSGEVGIHCDILHRTIKVDPETVGQFTGQFSDLFGVGGKRIFEGDVIKYFDIIVNEELTSCVEWWEDGFVAQEIGGFNAPSLCLVFGESQIEIIGNIHDNPELLKGVEGNG